MYTLASGAIRRVALMHYPVWHVPRSWRSGRGAARAIVSELSLGRVHQLLISIHACLPPRGRPSRSHSRPDGLGGRDGMIHAPLHYITTHNTTCIEHSVIITDTVFNVGRYGGETKWL